MSHAPWTDRAEIYAIGALDGADLAAFESHLEAGCRICEGVLATTREEITLLTVDVPPVPPADAVKMRLLSAIGRPENRPLPPPKAKSLAKAIAQRAAPKAAKPDERPAAKAPAVDGETVPAKPDAKPAVKPISDEELRLAPKAPSPAPAPPPTRPAAPPVVVATPPPPSRAGWIVAAASILVAAGLLVGLVLKMGEVDEAKAELGRVRTALAGDRDAAQAELARAERDLAELLEEGESVRSRLTAAEAARDDARDRVEELEELESLIQNPGVEVVRLDGDDERNPDAVAFLFYDRSAGRGLLLAHGLKQVGPAQVYTLWAMANAEPKPIDFAGAFRPNAKGTATLLLPALAADAVYHQFAVNVEPTGAPPPKPSNLDLHLFGQI